MLVYTQVFGKVKCVFPHPCRVVLLLMSGKVQMSWVSSFPIKLAKAKSRPAPADTPKHTDVPFYFLIVIYKYYIFLFRLFFSNLSPLNPLDLFLLIQDVCRWPSARRMTFYHNINWTEKSSWNKWTHSFIKPNRNHIFQFCEIWNRGFFAFKTVCTCLLLFKDA